MRLAAMVVVLFTRSGGARAQACGDIRKVDFRNFTFETDKGEDKHYGFANGPARGVRFNCMMGILLRAVRVSRESVSLAQGAGRSGGLASPKK